MRDQIQFGQCLRNDGGGVTITVYKRIGANGQYEFFTYLDRDLIPVSYEWIRRQKEPVRLIELTEAAGE